MSELAVENSLRCLNAAQVDFYNEHGYLHIPEVFSAAEIETLGNALNELISEWATKDQGWTGPWRKTYMDDATEKLSKLIALHDLQLYSEPWNRAVNQDCLCDCMADLLGPNVELHHSTLHAKPPETGHPFPMHQDWAFYEHANDRYVDVLIHLDDTDDRNGCIRFLDGSHKLGSLEHIKRTPEGSCTPHLPVDRYRLEDTVPVMARRGDVVVFNINTIHGSYMNRTDKIRRLVRVGYRDPENRQLQGQSLGRPGPIVRGSRSRQNQSGLAAPKHIEE